MTSWGKITNSVAIGPITFDLLYCKARKQTNKKIIERTEARTNILIFTVQLNSWINESVMKCVDEMKYLDNP